jgi:hypothetical protein
MNFTCARSVHRRYKRHGTLLTRTAQEGEERKADLFIDQFHNSAMAPVLGARALKIERVFSPK